MALENKLGDMTRGIARPAFATGPEWDKWHVLDEDRMVTCIFQEDNEEIELTHAIAVYARLGESFVTFTDDTTGEIVSIEVPSPEHARRAVEVFLKELEIEIFEPVSVDPAPGHGAQP